MSNKMKLIMENWRKLQEAAPTSAHHIVRRMKDTGDDALTALMHLIPELPREEASNWLKNNAQDINRAKRELGVTDNDRLNTKLNEATSVHPSVARRRWKEKQAAEKAAQKSQPKADVPGDALRPAAGPASRRASERKGKLGVGKKTWWESKGEPGYAEAWERIAAGDEALAKEVADLVWENGGGLRMHPHAVELDNKAKRLGGQMLSQQTGIEIDAWFSPVLPDDRPPGDERALEWKDFIDYELAKHLYYLHKQHGPELPYNVGAWDADKEPRFQNDGEQYADDLAMQGGDRYETDITLQEMDDIMETWRALKETPIWPQGHASAGREVHPSTMDAYRDYMKKHPKAKPPIKKNIKPPKKFMKGVRRRLEPWEYDDPSHLIDEEPLNEEGADCIKDYMAMGYSYREALAECGDDDDDWGEMKEEAT